MGAEHGSCPVHSVREDAWLGELDQARRAWDGAEPVEKLRITNRLLRTLEDSHSAVSTMHWIWDVENGGAPSPAVGD